MTCNSQIYQKKSNCNIPCLFLSFNMVTPPNITTFVPDYSNKPFPFFIHGEMLMDIQEFFGREVDLVVEVKVKPTIFGLSVRL